MPLKIGNKLALVLVGLSLLVIVLITALFYVQFERALKERVLLQLSSVKQLKTAQIFGELHHYIELINEYKRSPDTLLFEDRNIRGYCLVEETGILTLNGYEIHVPDVIADNEILIEDLTHKNQQAEITLAFKSRIKSKNVILIVDPDIQTILLERTGIGQTGESYLVGPDKLMRSDSRFLTDQKPTSISVNTEGVNKALNNISGTGMFPDYRGKEVFSAYSLVEFYGLRWVILSEIDREEAFIPLGEVRNDVIVTLIITLVLVLILSYWLSRQIVKPVLYMETALTNMSKGIIDQRIPEKGRSDEIGKMYHGLSRLIHALNQAVDFAREVGNENFDADYKMLSDQDKLGSALIQMKNELKNLKENEVRLVFANQRAIIRGEENERSRLSRELHDGIGPLLTTLKVKVQLLQMDEVKRNELFKVIDGTIQEVRRMSNNLMPSVLVDFGAGEAIGNLLKTLQNKHLKIDFRYEKNENVHIPKNSNITLYRIVQEAITNVIRHSEASEVKISLTEFDDVVSLFIHDNGKGFDENTVELGSGIINMKERVKLEHGTFTYDSGKGGTKIEVEIPI